MSEKIHTDGLVEKVRRDKKAFQVMGKWYSAFNELKVNVGDRIEFDYVEKGDFKNVAEPSIKWLSSSPKDITASYPQASSVNSVPQEVWEAKDRRAVRIDALNKALTLGVAIVEGDLKPLFDLAEQIENWVYR